MTATLLSFPPNCNAAHASVWLLQSCGVRAPAGWLATVLLLHGHGVNSTTRELCVQACTCIARRLSAPAPTPSMREAVETSPSLMPITAARSQGAPVSSSACSAVTQQQRGTRQGCFMGGVHLSACLPVLLRHGEHPPCQASPIQGLHAWSQTRQQLAQ